MSRPSTEDLVRGVVRALEEQQNEDRLARLSHGLLTEPEREQLEHEASKEPSLREVVLAYEPLSEAARERIVARLSEVSSSQSDDDAAQARLVSRARPPARRSLRRYAWLGMPLAAAAGAAFLLTRSSLEPIPRYDIELPPPAREQRAVIPGSGEPMLRPVPGQDIELLLRPEVASSGPLSAQTYLVRDGATPRQVSPRIERSPSGVLRLWLRWPAEDFGQGRLIVLVARPEAMTTDRVEGSQRSGRGWQRLEVPYAVSR